MLDYIKTQLMRFGIEDIEAIPLSMCNITRMHKLEKNGMTDISSLSVVIFTIPYYTENFQKNISSYCIPRDYHLFCKQIFEELIPLLRTKFSGYKFAGFADDSPIDERLAAAFSGLGILGDNGLLITEKHSSYVFLGEIVTDIPIEHKEKYELKHCERCGKCSKACPKQDIGECLSALTQKKGSLSENECNIIKKYGSAWGCDICQEVCPYTKKAIENRTIYTNIEFFKTELTPTLTLQMIYNMSDTDFSSRAYSWRRKETVLRNLHILED